MSPLELQLQRQKDEAAAEINDAARLANEIQALGEPSRSAALREAERIQRKHGLGWSLTVQRQGVVREFSGPPVVIDKWARSVPLAELLNPIIGSEEVDRLSNRLVEVVNQLLVLPDGKKPAAELSEREKVALAIHAGAPYAFEPQGARFSGIFKLVTLVPVGVSDRPGGGYIVAIGPREP